MLLSDRSPIALMLGGPTQLRRSVQGHTIIMRVSRKGSVIPRNPTPRAEAPITAAEAVMPGLPARSRPATGARPVLKYPRVTRARAPSGQTNGLGSPLLESAGRPHGSVTTSPRVQRRCKLTQSSNQTQCKSQRQSVDCQRSSADCNARGCNRLGAAISNRGSIADRPILADPNWNTRTHVLSNISNNCALFSNRSWHVSRQVGA